MNKVTLNKYFLWPTTSLQVFQKHLQAHTLQKSHRYYEVGTVVKLYNENYIIIGFMPLVTYLIKETDYKKDSKPEVYVVDTYEIKDVIGIEDVNWYLVKLLLYDDYFFIRKLANTIPALKELEKEFDYKCKNMYVSYFKYKW